MNVLSAMAGINNGEFCKKFTEQNVDIITIGGYNSDAESFKAGLISSTKEGRQEFLTCPHHLNIELSEEVEIIRNYNPSWKGLVCVNLRGTDIDSYKLAYDNKDIDIVEINAHCRQDATVEAGAGQALLHDPEKLGKILEEVTANMSADVGIKIRANVPGVNTLEIVDLIESYDVKYLHVDAMKPGVDSADLDIIQKISDKTSKHLIGNNSVKTHEDYLNILNSGADSVSVARAALDGDIKHIFTGEE